MKLDNFFDIETEFNFDKEKELFIENLDMLKSMSVQEQTLYKKWLEFNKDETTRQKFIKNYSKAEILYNNIWKPTDIYNKALTISEIEKLDPVVEIFLDFVLKAGLSQIAYLDYLDQQTFLAGLRE